MKKFQEEKDVTYLFIAHDLSIVRFISDRIGVIYKGDIVEIADAEELFDFPLHPYTHSLISAIPIPDPQLEKNKVLFTYDPSVHDYSEDKPELVCIGHDHWVFGNKKEIEEYKAIREKGEKIKSITILDPNKPETKAELEEAEKAPIIPESDITIAPVHDTGSAWYSIISFILPILGLVGMFLFKKYKHFRNAKACKKGTLLGFGALGLLVVLFAILLILVVI
jgi:oligopeptide transport system ATP-binding protein